MATTHSWHDRTHRLTDEVSRDLHDLATIRRVAPARQAFVMLWALFTLLPIVAGLDKFAEVLTSWEGYLATWVDDIVPGTASDAMLAVGVIEILAGLVVLVAPRYGAYIVALWLAAIIVNLVSTGEYYESPRGDMVPPAATLGPLGSAERLNWLAKNRLMNTSSQWRTSPRS
jgi:hypothetical protein